MRSASLGRFRLGLWLAAWLLALSVPVVASVFWRRADYPEGGATARYTVLPLSVAVLATIAWGFVLGRSHRWGTFLVSDLVGALASVVFIEIGSQTEPIGGEGGYYFLNWLLYCVAIGAVLGVGALMGLGARMVAAHKDRAAAHRAG